MSTTIQTPSNLQSTAILNALMPREGPKLVPIYCPFSGTALTFLADLTLASMQTRISVVQSLFVDNFTNPSDVEITVVDAVQVIKAPPYSQGFYPVMGNQKPKFSIYSAGQTPVTILAINVPIPANVWYAAGTQSISILDKPRTATAGNAFSVAVGGTAVNAILAGTVHGGALITNPLGAPGGESLFIDMVNAPGTVAPGANGTTIELVPGQSYLFPQGLQNLVQANAATNGHTFTCLVW